MRYIMEFQLSLTRISSEIRRLGSSLGTQASTQARLRNHGSMVASCELL